MAISIHINQFITSWHLVGGISLHTVIRNGCMYPPSEAKKDERLRVLSWSGTYMDYRGSSDYSLNLISN